VKDEFRSAVMFFLLKSLGFMEKTLSFELNGTLTKVAELQGIITSYKLYDKCMSCSNRLKNC